MANRDGRQYIRSFFTSPTAIEGDSSGAMLQKAIHLRGMQAPDVWVPDLEDGTAPSMREEGIENLLDVLGEHGASFPGEVHPRVVWHRENPETRREAYDQIRQLADPANSAVEYLDGFVIPEVGQIDDWKKADECITLVEHEHCLPEGSLAMSVIIESAQAELAMETLNVEMGKSTNNLERLYLLINGEVDYSKDMHGMTPTGALPPWPALRHHTSRAASAVNLVAVDGPVDDIRNDTAYRTRMTENYAKGILGIWALTPTQVELANTHPLPSRTSSCLLDTGTGIVELTEAEGEFVYDGDAIGLIKADSDSYQLTIGGSTTTVDEKGLQSALSERLDWIPSLDQMVDSMEQFEEAKGAGRGAISIRREITINIDGIDIEMGHDRMWDEATYQAAQIPVHLLQEAWEMRPDQHAELEKRYGSDLLSRALDIR